MSDTPRTDSLGVGKWLVGDTNVEMVRSDFARQLEREIAEAREATIDECALLAECAAPNDGRDHSECPFCATAKDIRALKNAAPQVAAADAISGESAQAGDHASSSAASPAVAAPDGMCRPR